MVNYIQYSERGLLLIFHPNLTIDQKEVIATFYYQMLDEYNKLEERISAIQATLQLLPEGNFFCSSTGKYHKWYRIQDKRQIYIPKAERPLAEKLASKKYLLCLLEDLSREKRAIEFYLRHHNHSPKKTEQLFKNPAYQELLSRQFTPDSLELAQWKDLPYQRNPNYQNQLLIDTVSGNQVRSKSEALIDMILYTNKIPYRYECALQLGDTTLYPDFTIRHPRTGQTYYWEHFGMMDDPNYAKKTYSKLQLYTENGLIPHIHVIATYETKTHPLSSRFVEQIIQYYFL